MIRLTHTFTEETIRQLADLAARWGGPLQNLPKSRVIAEALRRAWESESKKLEPQTQERKKRR